MAIKYQYSNHEKMGKCTKNYLKEFLFLKIFSNEYIIRHHDDS
jgi:hypothetical protein